MVHHLSALTALEWCLYAQRRTKTLAELSDDMDRLPAGRFTQPMTMFLLVTELKLVDGEHIGRTEKGGQPVVVISFDCLS